MGCKGSRQNRDTDGLMAILNSTLSEILSNFDSINLDKLNGFIKDFSYKGCYSDIDLLGILGAETFEVQISDELLNFKEAWSRIHKIICGLPCKSPGCTAKAAKYKADL